MPYIKKSERQELDADLRGPVSGGELNYVITRLVQRWIGPNPSYDTYAAAIGILETLKLELYRRAVTPYEDVKRKINGDVY